MQHAATYPASSSHTGDPELEEAIRNSVAETSRGNPEEDAMIERAIRASVLELQAQQQHHDSHPDDHDTTDESAAIERAMQASMAEAERYASEHGREVPDEELEKAIKESLAEEERKRGHPIGGGAQATGLPLGGDDSELKQAMKKSINPDGMPADDFGLLPSYEQSNKDVGDDSHAGPRTDEKRAPPKVAAAAEEDKDDGVNVSSKQVDDEEEIQKAITESKKAQDEADKQRSEEEIVLEYIKKQSLREEEHRQSLLAKGKNVAQPAEADGDDDEEELKKAIKLSMQREGAGGEASGAA